MVVGLQFFLLILQFLWILAPTVVLVGTVCIRIQVSSPLQLPVVSEF
jgi:hypothetical protein